MIVVQKSAGIMFIQTFFKVVHQPLNNPTTVMSAVNDFRSSVEEAAAGYCSLLPCSEEVIVREPLHFSLGLICVI